MLPSTAPTFDLIVVGATPGGIACAVRGAREGLRVLLTQYNCHIGGLWSNGLGAIDTQYAGTRCPIYSEFCDRILTFYREHYGRNSAQYRACFAKTHARYSDTGPTTSSDTHGAGFAPEEMPDNFYGRFNFEPHAAEDALDAMVAAESNITLWRECAPVEVEQSERMLRGIRFEFADGRSSVRAQASVFADCTYEGDLFALAGAPYRVGRESRSEFGEMHAGRIFTALHFAISQEVGYPRDAVDGRLNLEPYEAISQVVFAGSTGEGDRKVQAYTMRLCLSNDPNNRVMPEKPANYDRQTFLRMRNRWSLGSAIPNQKLKWNTSNLPGGNWDYPEADWPKRHEILERHRDHALGFLWFLQNDKAVPASFKEVAASYGLAKDEFTDNGHVPWEMYVREARRLVGRYIFTEHDATLAPGLQRAPIHRDSIAITEWGLDSHSVSMEMAAGSRREGKFLLPEFTRPGQVPFRCLLPPQHDNLLVPVCLSSTHVGWGTIRLEPTWMHVGEAAGFAAALALRERVAPAQLNIDRLQRQLVECGLMVAFFNDFDMAISEPWVAAIQFLGAKWFFSSYDARPDDLIDNKTASIWASIAADILTGRIKHLEEARWAEIYPEPGSAPSVTNAEFRATVEKELRARELSIERAESLLDELSPMGNHWRRRDACVFFYDLLQK